MKDFFDFSGFTTQQYAFLISGLAFFFASLVLYFRKSDKCAIILLVLSGLSLFTFAALLDPYLNLWDERFHALVAKNSMDNFLFPTLYKELPMQEADPMIWDSAHVWLHKQPLFIWQIMLSFKLFGVSEFTLRLPSVLMATGLIVIAYRIGSLLINKKLGYYTAVSLTFSWFLLNLVSGNGEVGHNNVCFVFYVSASVWAFMEYIRSGRKVRWLVAMAALAACAVLTKWLTGLLVFFVWGVYLLATYRLKLKEWKIGHGMLALGIVVALVAPWQIYTFITYPEVARVEYQNNSAHLFQALEGHGGDAFFYFKTLPYLYFGDKNYWVISDETIGLNPLRIISIILLLAGLALLSYRLKKNSHRIVLISTLLFVYIFFLLAETKMPAYPFCIAIIWFMSLGMLFYTVEHLIFKIKKRPFQFILWFIFVVLFAFYQMNFTALQRRHTDQYEYRATMQHNAEVFKKIAPTLPPKTILFNTRGIYDYFYPEAMFYTGALSYRSVPTEKQVQLLKNQGYKIAVFTCHEVPDYLQNDNEVIKIADILL